ncbi:MAG TPA: hypothetical protein VN814_21880 [Caulobacteraceae bacterium]|nr:hypothetical protein [Caulobacteraceae bacterium]
MRATTAVAAGLVLLSLAACARPPKEYDYPAWGFAASFQAPPKLTETPAAPDGSRGHSLLVASNSGLYDFEVFALEAPPPAKSIDEFTDAAAPVVAKSLGDEVGPTTYVATVQLTNQAMGREVQITKDGRPVFAMRVYQAGGRYYQVIARAPLGPTDPAAVAFLDSFKIIPATSGATNAG